VSYLSALCKVEETSIIAVENKLAGLLCFDEFSIHVKASSWLYLQNTRNNILSLVAV
jgi:hypothetical protein